MKSVSVMAVYRDGGSVMFACDGERYLLDQAIGSSTHGRIFKMRVAPRPPWRGRFQDQLEETVDDKTERTLKRLLQEQTNLRYK